MTLWKPKREMQLLRDLILRYNDNDLMKIDVSHIAKLANLPISSDEKTKFEKQLSEILSYVEKLKKVYTKNTQTTSQVTGLENVTREDEISQSLTQEKTLFNTKSKYNGLFKVKAILE